MERNVPGARRGEGGELGLGSMPVLKSSAKTSPGLGRKAARGGVLPPLDGIDRGDVRLPPLRMTRGGGDVEQKVSPGLSPQHMQPTLAGHVSPPKKASGSLEARRFRVSPIYPQPRPSPPKASKGAAGAPVRHHLSPTHLNHQTLDRPQPAMLHLPATSPSHDERHGPAERSPLQDANEGPQEACADFVPDVEKIAALLRNRGMSQESVSTYRQRFDHHIHASAAKDSAHLPPGGVQGAEVEEQRHQYGEGGASRPTQAADVAARRRGSRSPEQAARKNPENASNKEAPTNNPQKPEGGRSGRGHGQVHVDVGRLPSPPLIGCDLGLGNEEGEIDIDEETMMSLVYDEELKCYYDRKTLRYFKLTGVGVVGESEHPSIGPSSDAVKL